MHESKLKKIVFEEDLKIYICKKTVKMTKQELIDMINSWENLQYLQNELVNHPEQYKLLKEIAFYSNDPKSWRAAYLIDKINDNKPGLIRPFISEMIEKLKTERNESKKRHFLKLLSTNDLSTEQLGFLTDFCIDVFTSDKEPVAVRVHAMQVLFNISEIQPDLKPEILLIIEHEMENHFSAGILSRGGKLAQKLRKQIS